MSEKPARRPGAGSGEKNMLIQTLDHFWKEHLHTLDALRQVIHLRSYAQKKPIDEYKQEAFMLFERLLIAIREDVTRVLMRAQVQLETAPPPGLPDFITQHLDPFSGDDDTADIDFATGAIMSNLPPLNIPQPDMPTTADGEAPPAPCQPQRAVPVRLGQKLQHCHGSWPDAGRAAGGRRGRPERAAPRLSSRRGAGRARAHRAARPGDPGRGDRHRARPGQGRAGAKAVGPRRLPPRL